MASLFVQGRFGGSRIDLVLTKKSDQKPASVIVAAKLLVLAVDLKVIENSKELTVTFAVTPEIAARLAAHQNTGTFSIVLQPPEK